MPKMLDIHLSERGRSRELLPSSGGAGGAAQGSQDGGSAQSQDTAPRRAFPRVQQQGMKGSCPGELRVSPGPAAPLQPPALTVSRIYPITSQQTELQLHRDSLAEASRGWAQSSQYYLHYF